MRPGTLHLIPVPIAAGSLPAALPPDVLARVRRLRVFLAENARSARAFLKTAEHPDPIASLQIAEIGHAPAPALLDTWLAPVRAGADAAVLSEAGCPGIADPGTTLVARAHEIGIPVVPWVGPSAILLALMGSGMSGQNFRFLGYLPQNRDELTQRLLAVQREALRGETQIFIETPYRNQRLFDAILQSCDPGVALCLAIDLTGAEQQIATRRVAQWRKIAPTELPAMDKRPAVFLLGNGTIGQITKPPRTAHISPEAAPRSSAAPRSPDAPGRSGRHAGTSGRAARRTPHAPRDD